MSAHDTTLSVILLSRLFLYISHYPALTLAKDLGKIQSTSEPVVFALGLARDPVIQITANGKNETRYPFYKSKYNNAGDGVSYFSLQWRTGH